MIVSASEDRTLKLWNVDKFISNRSSLIINNNYKSSKENINESQSKVEELNKKNIEIENNLNSKMTEIEQLKQEKNNKISELENNLNIKNIEIKRLLDENRIKNNKIFEMESSLINKNKEIEKIKEEQNNKTGLETSLKNKNKDIEKMKEEKNKIIIQNKDLENNLNKLKQKIIDLEKADKHKSIDGNSNIFKKMIGKFFYIKKILKN